MPRFAHLATAPGRGPQHLLRWKLLDKLPGRRPPRRLDFAALDGVRPGVRDEIPMAAGNGAPFAAWVGHATWLWRLGGKLVVIDPVWSTRISGVVPRLVPPGAALDALPPIDLVLVTHDHMDHMDLPTLRRLGPQARYVVPLGNGERIAKLGHRDVVELDWWQSHRFGAVEVTLVPARHWSMRMPWTKNQTLWGGYTIRAPEGVAYHSGDTAFGDHFAEIGARFGPIDWAMLPIGGYEPRWFMAPQHVDPDEAAAGFLALGAKKFLAMHWGTFRLTDEAVGEPAERLRGFWTAQRLSPERLWLLDVGEARGL